MQISAKTRLMLLCQRLSNHYTTTDYFCCNTIKGTTSTTRWLSACACTAGESIRFLLLRLLAPDYLLVQIGILSPPREAYVTQRIDKRNIKNG